MGKKEKEKKHIKKTNVKRKLLIINNCKFEHNDIFYHIVKEK